MKQREGISSFTLHVLAMALMLCDHLWATFFPYAGWLTCLGRIAFPIFAFMIVEGYFHSRDQKRYLLRLFLCAIVSEVPFDLIQASTVFYPYHQNVLWVFVTAVLLIMGLEKIRKLGKWWLTIPACLLAAIFGSLFGGIASLEFFNIGVVTVLVFYFFRERKWWCFAGQLACLYYLNFEEMAGFCYNVQLFGHKWEFPQQGFALLALIPIWLYRGKQGYHAKWFRWFCYAFYPVHLLILYLLWSRL